MKRESARGFEDFSQLATPNHAEEGEAARTKGLREETESATCELTCCERRQKYYCLAAVFHGNNNFIRALMLSG